MADQAPATTASEDHPAVPPPAAVPAPLEYDGSEANDADSAYAESKRQNETGRLSSSILKYREENGRTYHSYGSTEHWGPNDEQAQDQQDLSHHFWTLCLNGKLYAAPIENPKRVLDLGTGTGIWAIDMADAHPDAIIKGTDLSPIQPVWVPPNLRFEIDDYNKDWGYENAYDLIHVRELLGSIPNWVEFFKKAYKALKPGGWLDCTEPDIRVHSIHHELEPTHPFEMWWKLFLEIDKKTGLAFYIAPYLKAWMEEAGFVNITENISMCAIGKWPKNKQQKELGIWNQLRLNSGLKDFAERRLRTVMNWKDDEILVLIAKCRSSIKDSKGGLYHYLHHLYGQKPENPS